MINFADPLTKDTFTQHFNTLKHINDKLQILRDKMKTIRSPKVMKLMNTQQVVRKGVPQLVRKVLPPGQIQQEKGGRSFSSFEILLWFNVSTLIISFS